MQFLKALAGFAGCVWWATHALASAPVPPPPPPPGGAVIAPDGSVMVSPGACGQVVAHVPDAGVAYVPGIDVNGQPVAPADLPESVAPPLGFSIVLNFDLRKRFGITGNSRLFRPQAEVGLITVEGNTVLFNGQPIGVGESDLLAAACRAHGFLH
ncbi:MAG TPA: hypothetical protein VLX09_07550 [Stellaceae bacterium]|nr:hypothetical protein [Stellaceae bacterium]